MSDSESQLLARAQAAERAVIEAVRQRDELAEAFGYYLVLVGGGPMTAKAANDQPE